MRGARPWARLSASRSFEARSGDATSFQLEGRRAGGEAKIGATLHKRMDLRRWQAFIRNAKRVKDGDQLIFGGGVTAIAQGRNPDGSMVLEFEGDEPVEVLLHRAGTSPSFSSHTPTTWHRTNHPTSHGTTGAVAGARTTPPGRAVRPP